MAVSQLQWKTVMFVSVFLSCVSFSVVMPSLWPYLLALGASKAFLAWVVAAYSVGEALGAVLYGWLSAQNTTRNVMLQATLMGAIGSVLYLAAFPFAQGSAARTGTAELPDNATASFLGPYLVLIGRFLQGLWTGGSQAVQQAHLAKSLPMDELTESTVILNAFACLGFVFGPAIALLASLLPSFPIPGIPRLQFNELTGAGFLVLCCTLLITFLFGRYFGNENQQNHHRRQHHTHLPMASATAEDFSDAATAEDETTPLLLYEYPDVEEAGPLCKHDRTCTCPNVTREHFRQHSQRAPAGYGNLESMLIPHPLPRPSSLILALVVCNIAFFTHFYGFAVQETITTPLVQAYYNWTVFQANLLFTAAGVASLFVFGALAAFSRYADDRMLTGWSLALGALGYTLLVSTPQHPLESHRFLAGFIIISVAFPVGRTTVIALYTKVLPRSWQGVGQGVILAVGAVSRILGPFWAVQAFYFTLGNLIVFGATAGMFILTLCMLIVTYGSLQVPKESLFSFKT